MSAGTITLTNNSSSVSGAGTSFTSDISAGDFIVATIGGIPYTLPVKSVDSATSLTLVSNYTGSTQSGASWYAVPRTAMSLITAGVVVQNTEALRGLNNDKKNWQSIFSSQASVTVTLPDNSTFTGPSWGSLISTLANKVSSDDTRLTTVNGKSGGSISSRIKFSGTKNGISITTQGNAGYADMYASADISPFFTDIVNTSNGRFYPLFSSRYFYTGKHAGCFWGGVIVEDTEATFLTGFTSETGMASGIIRRSPNADLSGLRNVSCVTLTQASDKDLKDKIEQIPDALEKINKLTGVTFNWKSSGYPSAGVIAQEVKEVLPECVSTQRNQQTNERFYSLEYPGLIGLLVEGIKDLTQKVGDLQVSLDGLGSSDITR